MKNFLEKSGYRQHGKIYIPPILQLGEFNGVYWLDDVLPELIWIALLQKEFGLGLGSKLALQISESTNELLITKGHKKWLAPLSCYSELTETDKTELRKIISHSGFLHHYDSAFNLFATLYPDFPLSFLISERNNSNDKLDLKEFKKFLADLYFRTNSAAVFMQATAVDMAFQADILKVNPTTSLARFPEIAKYPETEISKKVASGIFSTLNLYFGNATLFSSSREWRSYFWNRGLQIEKCY